MRMMIILFCFVRDVVNCEENIPVFFDSNMYIVMSELLYFGEKFFQLLKGNRAFAFVCVWITHVSSCNVIFAYQTHHNNQSILDILISVKQIFKSNILKTDINTQGLSYDHLVSITLHTYIRFFIK